MDERFLENVKAKLDHVDVRNKTVSFDLRIEDRERLRVVCNRLGVGQCVLLRSIVLTYLDLIESSSLFDQEVGE